jgi:hypothetical protein
VQVTKGIGVLIIFPSFPLGKYGGGMAMVAFPVIGLIAYFVLFGERLRSRGQIQIAAIATAVGVAIAVALSLVGRGHWR